MTVKKCFLLSFVVILFFFLSARAEVVFPGSLRARINFFLGLKKEFQQAMEKLEKFKNTEAGKRVLDHRYERVFYNYLIKGFENTSTYIDWLVETAVVEDMLGKDREQNIVFNTRRIKIFREDILNALLYGLNLVIENTSCPEFKNLCLKIRRTMQEVEQKLQEYGQ